jgi:hypothetical protein
MGFFLRYCSTGTKNPTMYPHYPVEQYLTKNPTVYPHYPVEQYLTKNPTMYHHYPVEQYLTKNPTVYPHYINNTKKSTSFGTMGI